MFCSRARNQASLNTLLLKNNKRLEGNSEALSVARMGLKLGPTWFGAHTSPDFLSTTKFSYRENSQEQLAVLRVKRPSSGPCGCILLLLSDLLIKFSDLPVGHFSFFQTSPVDERQVNKSSRNRKTRCIPSAPQTQNPCSSVPQLDGDGGGDRAGQGTGGEEEAGSEATLNHPFLSPQALVDQGWPKSSKANRRPIVTGRAKPMGTMFLSP